MANFNQILDPNNYTPENVNKVVNKTISNIQSGATLKSLAQPNMSVNTQTMSKESTNMTRNPSPTNMSTNISTTTVPTAQKSTYSTATVPTKTLTDTANIDYAIKNYGYVPPTTKAESQAVSDAKSGVETSQPAQTYFNNISEETSQDAERFRVGGEELKRMQEEARAGGLNIPDYASRSTTDSKATMYSDIPEIAALDAEYAAEQKRYDEYMAKAAEQNKQMIQMIRDNYSRQREETKIANQNRLKAQEILGTRSGRQRYAPEIQEGYMSAEEKAGLTRLSDLQREEEALVQQAVNAQSAKEFEMLGKVFSLKQEKRKEQNQILQQMYENSLKKEETAIKKMNAEKEQKKELISDLDFFAKSGMSLDDESGSYLDSLLGYGKGASQAYVEAQRATNKLDKMTKEFEFLSKVPPDMQVPMPDGTMRSGMKEIDPMKGISSFTESDNDGNVTQVFTTFDPVTKKPVLLDIITYPSIAKFSTTPGTTKVELGTGINNAINGAINSLNFGSVDMAKTARATIEDYLSTGDIEGAKDYIKTVVVNSADPETRRTLDQKNLAIQSLEEIRKDLEDYVASGGNTNVFTGLSQKALEKGGFVKDPKLAEIANKIALNIIDYRKAVSGAAFTESEGAAYDAIFPSTGKTPALNNAKINSLIDTFKKYDENFLKRRIGERNYNQLFSEENKKSGGLPDPTSFSSPEEYENATKVNGVSPVTPYIDMVIDFYEKQGVTNYSNDDFNRRLKDLMERKGASFNEPLSKGKKGSTYTEGTVTGYGSKLWKPGLDYVVPGGKGGAVTAPFDGVVVDIVGGYSNPKAVPLNMSVGKSQNKGFGNQVKIRRSDGTEVWLSHLDSVGKLKKGQKVSKGFVVGTQGNTGSTYGKTGVHVDITMVKPKGGYYTAQEVKKIIKG